MSQISLTFPDGAKRAVQAGTTGLDVAKSIAPSLAKRSVAMSLNGKLADLAAPIKADAAIKFLTREDKEALELIRHDAAHVMAQAVQELFPGTQVTIGPVIENGFYYDFAREEPFTPEDLPKIEAKMSEIIARDAPFSARSGPQGGEDAVRRQGRALQGRADRRDSRGRRDHALFAGRVARPVPRPASDLDRQGRQGLQAD